jgi:ribonuclease T1
MLRSAKYAAILLVAALVGSPVYSVPQRSGRPTSQEIPQAAIDVYFYVLKHHVAPSGHIGGRVWKNREKNLPAGGNYHEFDVNPKVRGRNRGAERVVVDYKSGKGWYTSDHYRTFVLIPRGP